MWVKQMPGPTLDHIRQRREEIIALASHHGARNVRVFGSVARGDAGAGSDVDFVVDFDTGRSLMDHGELIMDLESIDAEAHSRLLVALQEAQHVLKSAGVGFDSDRQTVLREAERRLRASISVLAARGASND
jgi:predicted nucleotidyltransferase